ncbi:MAG: hypothetical protein AAF492_22480, partial [Verrucomicrobiota bacterium]
MKKFFTILLGLVAANSAFASLEAAREKFVASSNKIELTYMTALDEATADYMKTLSQQSRTMRSQGNLEAVLEIKNELDRFKKDRDVTEQPPEAPFLQAAHQRFSAVKKRAQRARDEQAAQLLTFYVNHLTKLQKQFVQQNKVEAAVAVRQEAEKIKAALQVYQQADAERKKRLAEKRAA